jgi:uncharacterized protein YaiE (UPF0345 family)
MIKTNEYFKGNVKSLGLNTPKGPATVGVMLPGEYEFGTSTVEIMTVTSGKLDVLLPSWKRWKTFGPGKSFKVQANVKFKVRCNADVAYLCLYK